VVLVPNPLSDAVVLAAPPPSTPLGPFSDSALAWTTWVTLMGFVGLVALALFTARPAARPIGQQARATRRLGIAAGAFGLLAMPAVLSELTHQADSFGDAWAALYDGTGAGLMAGLEVTLAPLGGLLALAAAVRKSAQTWLLGAALTLGALALITTKFPTEVPDEWGATIFDTGIWVMHLLGGAVWIGGLIGLLLLALPGGVAAGGRGAFFAKAIRRFSIVAMTCVGAITLSGLFLYWQHVDGPEQLITTMYGRVLGVKLLIFGSLMVLGIVNQFLLHPKIEALRAAGDDRPLRTVLMRQFPVTIGLEVLLGLSVLMVAPFLHGSARNQAFQAEAAANATSADAKLPKIADKAATTTTWLLGTGETVLVIAVMVGGYRVSGRIAARRVQARAAIATA
jgi:putative copper export protein